MTNTNTFNINKGSDLTFSFNWPDGAGGNADLTGYTVSIYDETANLIGNITAVLTTPNVGLITVTLEWVDAITVGVLESFSVKILLGSLDVTTNKLWINVL